jgi:hypothetical protein
MIARIHVRVRNTGMKASPAGSASAGPRVVLLTNDHGVDYSVAPAYRDAGAPQPVPALAPGESTELVWDGIAVPQSLGIHALTARIVGNDSEINHSNDEITRWF